MLDVERRELRRDGEPRPIEPQSFELLKFLIENRDRVVSRDEIFRVVWRGRIVVDSVLGTRINAVRASIGDDGARQRLIRTVRGSGFRFVGSISAGTHRSAGLSTTATYRLAATLKDAPAVAVLPFTCIGEDGRARLVAEALREEVVSALCDIDWLPVVSHDPAVQASGTAALPEAGRQSRARYLLCGSLRLERDDARAIVRLIDAATTVNLSAGRFRFPMPTCFAEQQEIAEKVADAVGDQVFAAERIRTRRGSPDGLDTWGIVIRALDLINSRNEQKAAAAQAMLAKAVDIDPQSSVSFALLSFVATLGVHQAWHSRQAARRLANGAAERALALNDEDPWAHLAAGYAKLYVANEAAEAIDILKRALALDPHLSIAHYLIALASTFIKKPDDAFAHAELAEALKARDLLARGNTGAHDNVRATASFVTGRYRDGIAFARKAIAQSPRQTSAYRQLVTNSAYAGEVGQAAQAFQIVKRLGPELDKFIRQSEALYSDKSDYRKYVEAFREAARLHAGGR
ncbi:MAG TPA: winged helix-turn-helix domain-containing protein [Xanthobacteraceae bacterium]|nr:winged helix-turn-helix domain-containing protein [Xanthobacteraceae bacterium]